jgi:metal iron transporter
MPHALFLGSNLATQDRVSQSPEPLPPPVDTRRPLFLQRLRRMWTGILYITRSQRDNFKDYTTRHEFRQNNSMEFIHAHLRHGTVDVILSLLGLAVPINSAYVTLLSLLSSFETEGPGY